MNDAEIMVILILFHSGGFKCFKHYYKEYVCKHLTHLFLHRYRTTVLWNWKIIWTLPNFEASGTTYPALGP